MMTQLRIVTVVFLLGTLAFAGFRSNAQTGGAKVTRMEFGKLPDGRSIDRFTLTNSSGMQVQAITWGAIITSIRVPDRNGKIDDVVLGYDTLDPYVRNPSYFGAIVGRYANRIANGKFTLDGKEYTLATNNRPNHLHGGTKGFDKQVWDAKVGDAAREASVSFTYRSIDGEEGYPGTVNTVVSYTLTDKNELIVEYRATTDKATPFNPSQHSYFNLTGASRDVLDHEVAIFADRYTPTDTTLIPTGELASVGGTPFDFRKPTTIGARINDSNPQLRQASGYDHNYIINRQGAGLVPAARVVEPTTGRTLEVSTTEPGMQFYTANTLNAVGKAGRTYQKYYAFCLETEHYPDSPNKPQFPSSIILPGTEFTSKSVYTFSVAK
jgi:aldose 1-epimerase